MLLATSANTIVSTTRASTVTWNNSRWYHLHSAFFAFLLMHVSAIMVCRRIWYLLGVSSKEQDQVGMSDWACWAFVYFTPKLPSLVEKDRNPPKWPSAIYQSALSLYLLFISIQKLQTTHPSTCLLTTTFKQSVPLVLRIAEVLLPVAVIIHIRHMRLKQHRLRLPIRLKTKQDSANRPIPIHQKIPTSDGRLWKTTPFTWLFTHVLCPVHTTVDYSFQDAKKDIWDSAGPSTTMKEVGSRNCSPLTQSSIIPTCCSCTVWAKSMKAGRWSANKNYGRYVRTERLREIA